MLIPLHDDNPTKRFPVLTVSLIVVNVAVFALFSIQDNHTQRYLTNRFGFVPQVLTNLPDGKVLEVDLYPELEIKDQLELEDIPVVPAGKPRKIKLTPSIGLVIMTMLTSMFMHAGLLHIGMNMLFLWVFGNNIEDRLGRVVFLLFYLIGGCVACLCHWAFEQHEMANIPCVGASGAVAVMLGAYAVAYPTAKVLVFAWICIPLIFRIPAMFLLGIWLAFQLYEAFLVEQGMVSNVALWAHIGGFFTGVVSMPALAAGTQEPGEDWEKEAQEQFDFDSVDPESRKIPGSRHQDDTGIWWE